jgi:hypothetical protein
MSNRRMNGTVKAFGWVLLVGLVLSVALVAAAVSLIGSMETGTVLINGAPLMLPDMNVAHWALGIGGVLVAIVVVLLIVLFVVPFAVLVPLAFAALAVVAALVIAAGATALALSPFILLVALVWFIARRVSGSGTKPSSTANATIAE